MTVTELIAALQSFENPEQEVYVWNGFDDIPIKNVSLFDSDAPEGEDNPLEINLLDEAPF